RYLYTEAGAKAAELLGTIALDRGDYAVAALRFERLFQSRGQDRLPPLTLFKAALAFHHAGDTRNEDRAWKVLAGKAERLTLGNGKVYSVAELRAWVRKRP